MDDPTRDENPLCKITFVDFRMRADNLNPNEVTEALGIHPTRTYARGDTFRTHTGSKQRPWGVWILSTEGAVDSASPERHAQYMIEQIWPKRRQLGKYLKDPAYYIDIYFRWEVADTVSGFTVASETVRRLAGLCNFISISFCSHDDPVEEP